MIMQKWEYTWRQLGTPLVGNTEESYRYKSMIKELMGKGNTEVDMDEIGKQGWELVGIDCRFGWAYFKRPIEEEKPFDFRFEMHQTRLEVDRLLEGGKQRKLLWTYFQIRALFQDSLGFPG